MRDLSSQLDEDQNSIVAVGISTPRHWTCDRKTTILQQSLGLTFLRVDRRREGTFLLSQRKATRDSDIAMAFWRTTREYVSATDTALDRIGSRLLIGLECLYTHT